MLNEVNQEIRNSRVSAIPAKLLQQGASLRTIALSDVSLRGKFILWGNPDDSSFTEAVSTTTGLQLPKQCGEVTETNAYKAIWANPKRWYLICEPDAENELAQSLAESRQVHVQVTDGQCCFHLKGNNVVNVLKKGCSLNFNAAHFASNQCLQTRLAITKVFLHRLSDDSVDIYVERSYGEYIWSWLLDAAKEYDQ